MTFPADYRAGPTGPAMRAPGRPASVTTRPSRTTDAAPNGPGSVPSRITRALYPFGRTLPSNQLMACVVSLVNRISRGPNWSMKWESVWQCFAVFTK
jgi:hypothetical protein